MKKEVMLLTFSVLFLILIIIMILFSFYSDKEPKPNEQNKTNNIHNEKTNTQIPNPGGSYCKMLGYRWRINETKEGQQGICVFPDGTECDEWRFYAGLCSQNWSYCKLHGYDIISGDVKSGRCRYAYSPICSVCVNKTTQQDAGTVDDLINLSK
ncbi:MAG: DUF333 domain-containing protein, partial [Nanoarchaeota archaeon]|nr:DUF333 domain-containing protein [Nanoarchaeota archaeon]